MYKYGKVIAFFATIAWLGFTFSAFKGFHFWYAGFVFFFWLALASINYKHDTSLWFIKNRPARFCIFYYLQAVVLGFLVDFVIGQKLTDFWIYPWYQSLADWLRLYFFIYPIGGLAVLELVYFLSGVFGESFRLVVYKKDVVIRRFVDKLDVVLMYLLYLIIFSSPIVLFVGPPAWYKLFLFWFGLSWPVIATIKLDYHLAHRAHWPFIFIGTLLLSVFLHEVPNVGAFEWKYQNLPAFQQQVFGVPLAIIIGWYVLVIGTFRLWLYWVLEKEL